jgi:hypothetical protein
METKLINYDRCSGGGGQRFAQTLFHQGLKQTCDPANREVGVTDSIVGINKSYFHTQTDNHTMAVHNILP